MEIYTWLLTGMTVIWIAYEVWLVIRDRLRGKGKTVMDRQTRNYNFLLFTLGMTVAGILSGFPQFWFMTARSQAVYWVGFTIMWLGLILRIWSVATLGYSFRTTVEVDQNQPVVKHGPYKWIRHPSYSGLLLICCGFGIAVQNWLSLTVVIVLPLLALLYRIRIEEAALLTETGKPYQEYQRHTKRLIPGIW